MEKLNLIKAGEQLGDFKIRAKKDLSERKNLFVYRSLFFRKNQKKMHLMIFHQMHLENLSKKNFPLYY